MSSGDGASNRVAFYKDVQVRKYSRGAVQVELEELLGERYGGTSLSINLCIWYVPKCLSAEFFELKH